MWGLMLAGLAGGALWAFADQPRHGSVNKALVDALSTVVFLCVSGLLLKPLIRDRRSLLTFYKTFVPAFFAYATIWWVFCYVIVFRGSDWLGAFLACAAFALILATFFHNFRAVPFTTAVLFAAHSIGSLLASVFVNSTKNPADGIAVKLGWAACFTAFLGCGIGYSFYAMQKKNAAT